MTKEKNKIMIGLLLIAFVICMLIAIIPQNVYAETDSSGCEEETSFTCDATIDDNFDEGSVLVLMEKSESEVNKNHSQKFADIDNIEKITDLTYVKSGCSTEYLDLSNFHQILKIDLLVSSKQNVLEMIEEIEKIPGVLYADVNTIYETESTEAEEENLSEEDLWGLYGNYGVHRDEAWNYTTGSSAVKVGILDSGIADHPDLEGKVTLGYDMINGDQVTNDDNVGHGTNVAGIIASSVVGINQDVQLVPFQVTVNNTVTSSTLAVAIVMASMQNIEILNYSAGHIGSIDTILTAALGIYKGLFVCSAGNESNDNDTNQHFPSNFSLGQDFSDRVISVGALSKNGTKTEKSNYGSTTVSVFAPGENIYTTGTNEDYVITGGTSMASAYVSGVAALLFAAYKQTPNTMSLKEQAISIKSIIVDNVTRNSNLNSYCVAKGQVNALKCLENMNVKDTIMDIGYEGSEYKWQGQIDMSYDKIHANKLISQDTYEIKEGTTIKFDLKNNESYNAIYSINGSVEYSLTNSSNVEVRTHTSTVNVNILNEVTINDGTFSIDTVLLANGTYTLTIESNFSRDKWSCSDTAQLTFIINQSSCVAEGSMITLDDGSQKAVEDLTGEERLLVWNMFTGEFDSAPILFIDSDSESYYEVINLYFSDGTTVKVISEHAFWDVNLNEYVFLRSDAAQYIGHWFNKQTVDGNGNMGYTEVQLTNVVVQQEYTSAWSPVTYGHLCYYVNGMLSMPGATTGLINIFEVDSDTMAIDQEAYLEDVEEYGLFTYEEFNALCSIPEAVFNAFGGQYLKVSLGKGLITWEELENLIARYSEFWN